MACVVPAALRRSAILTLKHCARPQRGTWNVSLWCSPGTPDCPPKWKVILDFLLVASKFHFRYLFKCWNHKIFQLKNLKSIILFYSVLSHLAKKQSTLRSTCSWMKMTRTWWSSAQVGTCWPESREQAGPQRHWSWQFLAPASNLIRSAVWEFTPLRTIWPQWRQGNIWKLRICNFNTIFISLGSDVNWETTGRLPHAKTKVHAV